MGSLLERYTENEIIEAVQYAQKRLFDEMKSDYENDISTVPISDFYNDYTTPYPTVYQRTGSLFSVPEVSVDRENGAMTVYIELEPDRIVGFRDGDKESLYDITIKRGYHGGPYWPWVNRRAKRAKISPYKNMENRIRSYEEGKWTEQMITDIREYLGF